MPLEIVLPPLHSGQQEVWASNARFKVVCCGRRWGKTHMGVLKCVEVASQGGQAWWVGPTYPVGLLGWDLLLKLVRPIPGLEIRVGEKKVVFPGGGWVQVKSAERPEGLRGESLDYVVLDEVADIGAEAWFESLRPALADRQGGAMFIGTPRGQSNWFFDLWNKAQKDKKGSWGAWQRPTSNNPFIPPDEIEDARLDLDSITFAQEFLAEFVISGGTVFKPEWERYYAWVGDPSQFHGYDQALWLIHEGFETERCHLASCLRFATIDLAVSLKEHADFTVMAIWARTPGKRLVLLDVVRDRMIGPQIVPQMWTLFRKWNLSYLGVESGNAMLSIIQQAQQEGLPIKALRPDKDKLQRATLASARMESGQVWYPREDPNWLDAYRQEVRAFPLAAHDDCVDTLSYACEQLSALHTGPQLVSW